MKIILRLSFLILLFCSINAYAGFLSFFSGSEKRSESLCVKETAKVGDVIPSGAGNTLKILSIEGKSPIYCKGVGQPIRAFVEYTFSFKSSAGMKLSDDYEVKTLTEFQRYNGIYLIAASKSVKRKGIQVSSFEKKPNMDPTQILDNIEKLQISLLNEGIGKNYEKLVINGANAWRFEVVGKTKSAFPIEMIYLTTVIESDKEILLVATYDAAVDYEKDKDEFKKISTDITGLEVSKPASFVLVDNAVPAVSAAIGNVASPINTVVGQANPNQPIQVTTNPIDLQKKTSANEVWLSFNPSITVQQRQFCRIIENFRTENAIAKQSRNDIKVNQTFKELVQSLVSLLPDGKFQGWVMRTVYVAQASNGSAEVLLELPCSVYVGSNACDTNPNNFYGTAPENSRIYTELAKMSVGDFALTSGKFVYSDKSAFDKNRSVASFGYMKTASHCRAKEIASDSDFFGLSLETISTIK